MLRIKGSAKEFAFFLFIILKNKAKTKRKRKYKIIFGHPQIKPPKKDSNLSFFVANSSLTKKEKRKRIIKAKAKHRTEDIPKWKKEY